MEGLPATDRPLVILTSWRSGFIGTWSSCRDVNSTNKFTDCSYRGAGCQSLRHVVLRALVDSELGMFRVLWGGVCRAKVKRWQSACRCWWTLTWRGVRGRRGVDLGQGGVTAARTSLLGGASLQGREGGGVGEGHISGVRCVNKLTTRCCCCWSSSSLI